MKSLPLCDGNCANSPTHAEQCWPMAIIENCFSCVAIDEMIAHMTCFEGGMQGLLAKVHPLLLQEESCLDVAVNVQKKYT